MLDESAIASELGLPKAGVRAVLRLLADKNTVPFIARYRKEASGGLDEVQIRAIAEKREYHIALDERRSAIIAAIESQGAMTSELRDKLEGAKSKAELEDLYLPFKRKRRTRAQVARERGLEELARLILSQPRTGDPKSAAKAFVGGEVPDVAAALAGARDIVAECIAESSEVRRRLRQRFAREAVISSKAARGKAKAKSKFEQYLKFQEPVTKIPSHRYLAIVRGENEGFLSAKISIAPRRAAVDIANVFEVGTRSPFASELRLAIDDSFARLLGPSLDTEFRSALKERSDRSAVEVFAENLENLLLQAPLGGKAVFGIDPGLRTGCKCAVLDATGKHLAHTTLFLMGSQQAKDKAHAELRKLIERYKPDAIAVGNGTGGRETEVFVRKVVAEVASSCMVVSVSESGASIYSASDIAREEFPDLDLTVRGAISIGRRLQDPLSELVKVDPKSIGVGQYQHDVDQKLLSAKLGEVIESCVNRVGVELNTASAVLLSYVAGIGKSLAKKIVSYREKHGAFASRTALLKVSGLGQRAFEQCAGFLRIHGGASALDASAVHPERYSVVDQMAKRLGVAVPALVGNTELVKRIDIAHYIGDEVGEPTLRDIISELQKPGRDPRKQFEAPTFRDDINEIEDLGVGMTLEGVVTNVTAFGAFVDIGVHQDGLVHVSQLSDHFVKDPSDVVRVGDRLQVHVLEVDLTRKRISLSAKKQPS